MKFIPSTIPGPGEVLFTFLLARLSLFRQIPGTKMLRIVSKKF